jgi:Chromatin remodeling factor Mit1 C-terminal Zn finger 2
MGWCRLKLAGVEHCGLCGIAHLGHGRTCPHLNSEVQVATLLGTLKESTESMELKEKATKYLRMVRGDLVQRKRMFERRDPTIFEPRERSATKLPKALTAYQPRMDPMMIDGNVDVLSRDRPAVVNGTQAGAVGEWRNSAFSNAHGLHPPVPPGSRVQR